MCVCVCVCVRARAFCFWFFGFLGAWGFGVLSFRCRRLFRFGSSVIALRCSLLLHGRREGFPPQFLTINK